MRVKLLMFSTAKELAGFEVKDLHMKDGSSVGDLYQFLEECNNKFRRLRSAYRIAVNNEYAMNDRILQQGDEVAIIPPVSGG
jgi:molybdopterin converting factor subunit 1